MAHLIGELKFGEKVASWVRDGTLEGCPLVVLAHGAGAPLASPFMEKTAAGLVERGLCVVRFHFPYMERTVREKTRRPPNTQKVLLETWEEMLCVVHGWKGHGPITLAGKSMGGRMASLLLAEGRAPQASAAVYLGYPLHPPGRPEKLRSEHLGEVPVPQLFISGSRDNLCKLELLKPVLEKIGAPARLHIVEGGDHSLAPSRKAPFEGMGEWLDKMAEFAAGDSGE